MQVIVSIGSCAFIGENSYDWATSRGLALSVLRVSVRGLPGHFLLIKAKMHVKVSTGSCATLWENTVTVGLRSRGDALYVESQCSWAVVKNS